MATRPGGVSRVQILNRLQISKNGRIDKTNVIEIRFVSVPRMMHEKFTSDLSLWTGKNKFVWKVVNGKTGFRIVWRPLPPMLYYCVVMVVDGRKLSRGTTWRTNEKRQDGSDHGDNCYRPVRDIGNKLSDVLIEKTIFTDISYDFYSLITRLKLIFLYKKLLIDFE